MDHLHRLAVLGLTSHSIALLTREKLVLMNF